MKSEEICRVLGKNIRLLRTQNGWSQETLAEKMELSSNFMSNIENGKAWISPATLSKFTEIFDVPPRELFTQELDVPPAIATLIYRYTEELKDTIIYAIDNTRSKYENPLSNPVT